MKAIQLQAFGGPDNLLYTELPRPVPAADEVLIQVHAISINPVDAKTRGGKGIAGRIKDSLPVVLGWDVSGTVVEIGAGVVDFKIGDEVFGMVNFPALGNGYAEFVAAPADGLALKPDNVSHEEAAATTLAALTAWQAFEQAALPAGAKVLIHAAAGGVGHFAVQIAKHLGLHVTGTSSAANRDFVLSLGADTHIDYEAMRFEEALSDADFVLDTVGGDNITRSFACLRPGGLLISIPTGISPAMAEAAAAKDIRAFFFLVKTSGDNMRSLADLLEKGLLKPWLNRLPFDQMPEAHRQQESGKTRGKIVLSL